jgi:peptidoglycan glycosyltransferase
MGFQEKLLTEGDAYISSALDTHLQTDTIQENKGRIVDRENLAWPTRLARARDMLTQWETPEEAANTLDSLYHLLYGGNYGIAGLKNREFYGRHSGVFSAEDGIGDLYTKKGHDVYITVSGVFNKRLNEALKASGADNGAAILTNYKTGEILAWTSIPSSSVGSPLLSQYDEDHSRKEAWMIDRVVDSVYQPGSIQKIATALTAMRYAEDMSVNHMNSALFTCTGELELPGENNKVTCPSPHAEVTLAQGFSVSCNCMFAWLASEAGRERLIAVGEDLGYNKTFTYMDEKLVNPVSRIMLPADLSEYGIGWSGSGQDADGGDVKVQPYHMNILISAIANNGKACQPYIISRIVSREDGEVIEKTNPDNPGYLDSSLINITASEALDLKTLMKGVCRENGTAAELGAEMKELGYTAGAKTGTAEISQTTERLNESGVKVTKGTVSWIACFLEEKPFALVVAAQNPSVGNAAAKIASDVLPLAIEMNLDAPQFAE